MEDGSSIPKVDWLCFPGIQAYRFPPPKGATETGREEGGMLSVDTRATWGLREWLCVRPGIWVWELLGADIML